MGIFHSIIRVILPEVFDVFQRYHALKARIHADPGVPVPNPTKSFWMSPPAELPPAPSSLPDYADIVIIGSGITGASIARTLFASTEHRADADKVTVVVLDAREACGGATGRNGGHIKPGVYEEYPMMKARHGATAAQQILQFRIAHIRETVRVAEEESVLETTGARQVEGVDVVTNERSFAVFKERLAEWKTDDLAQARAFRVYDATEAREVFGLSDMCKGVIAGPAGALHPYRLVTAVWKRLLRDYPKQFFLFAHTTCTSVSAGPDVYSVVTTRGTIRTRHVVHATNAYVSHLLPQMRGKIFPVRATCTAQRPGQSARKSTGDGARSWLFYHEHAYDYLSQLPGERAELILGGGMSLVGHGFGEIGVTDDSRVHSLIRAYLGGALPTFFGEDNWGREGEAEDDAGFATGRVKATWTGIICYSADRNPWVGRLPQKISQRRPPAPVPESGKQKLARPGEWIAAGYSGEGMSGALLSGRALAYMILDEEDTHGVSGWLPEALLVTEQRWARVKAEDLLEDFHSVGM